MMGNPAPVPNAAEVAGVMSLLAVLADPKAAGERLAAIVKASGEAKAAAESMAAQLQALNDRNADLEREEKEAADLAEKLRVQAANLQDREEAMVKRKRALEAHESEVHKLADDTAAALAAREAALNERQSQFGEKELQLGQWSERREREVTEREILAAAKLKEAEELRAKYEAKMADLRRMAG